jgi:hypothetical protein
VAAYVDRRQPEVKREEPKLQAKRSEDERRYGDHRAGLQYVRPLGDSLHVQATGDAVERRDPDKEHDRPEQVDDREDEGAPHLVVLLPVAGQDERRGHGDLEEHVEVEDVPRQEEAREPRGHEQNQRRKGAPAHPQGEFVEQRY